MDWLGAHWVEVVVRGQGLAAVMAFGLWWGSTGRLLRGVIAFSIAWSLLVTTPLLMLFT